MATWVKICGVTRFEDARAAFDCGADAIGINFWPRSRRYCEPAAARRIVEALPAGAPVYGVFVAASRGEILELVHDVGLAGVQLHGGEPASEAEGWDRPVIRAVAASSREAVLEAVEACARYRALAGGASAYRLLVDHASGGGSGRTVDASLLDGVDLSDAVLAGGLTPDNVAATVARRRPFGVDTAGGVESAPGIKDPARIAAFVREARKA